MADAPGQPDLSMEEILAVIRRNIAEDARPPGLRSVPPPEPVEVLELTDAIDDDGTLRRIEPRRISGYGRTPEPTRHVDHAALPSPEPHYSDAEPTPPPRDREAVGGGSRSLEDVVADMLRPLLRQWLDTHLPAVIERLIREEMPGRRMNGD